MTQSKKHRNSVADQRNQLNPEGKKFLQGNQECADYLGIPVRIFMRLRKLHNGLKILRVGDSIKSRFLVKPEWLEAWIKNVTGMSLPDLIAESLSDRE